MKDGRAIVWGYVRHEGHVCTVGDRVWGPRFAFDGLRRSRRRDAHRLRRVRRGQNSGPPLT
eukprot:4681511-Prymnesium_polylepis.1